MTFNNDTLVRTPANPDLSGSINRGTGIVTLSFRPPGANHNTAASGVLLEDDPDTNAAGWFLGEDQSGSFTMQP